MVLNEGRDLELYSNTIDVTGSKPPRETISLTTDLVIESRKLPLKTKAPNTPESSFLYTESFEPDSVIELRLPGKGGSTKTITLQCFSLEEENRWRSNLQVRYLM